jgi:flagellar biosynthesis/type III secretory pathway protein FliH
MAVSIVITPARLVMLVTSLFVLAAPAAAQYDDWHMFSRELFIKSTFAHGYMHGYEEGFHSGDLDMQMGRAFREAKYHEKYKKPTGYKVQFGDKGVYDQAYRYGYLVAYIDCYEGRNFRAASLIREGTATNPKGAVLSLDREFDNGFRQGYEVGQKRGLQDGRSAITGSSATFKCEDPSIKGGGKSKSDYCEAFRHGYELGYSDGFSNQRERGKVVAKK